MVDSIGEATFLMHCQAYNLKPQREVMLIAGRKWRVDFFFEYPRKVAVEIEGGTMRGKSRHSFGAGFARDCEKYNAISRAGIILLRYSTQMVTSGAAITEVLEVLEEA